MALVLFGVMWINGSKVTASTTF